MAPSTSSERRTRRNAEREAPRPDGRQKLLNATETLLGEASLADLSVNRITDEAQVSRGTFYVHFESKYEVTAALLGRVMEEMYGLLAPITNAAAGPVPDDAIREVVGDSAALWQKHRAVFRATHENYVLVPELRELWLGVTAQFTAALAQAFEGRIAGAADRDVRQVCATLVWATEHLLYIAGTETDADLPSPQEIVGSLVDLWVGMLYGRRPEGPEA